MAQPSEKGMRTLIAGIFCALFLKSIDKQLLGLMKPVLDGVFGWSAETYADIAALSQLVGAISLLAAGRIVDRFPVRATLAVGVLTWSIFTAGQALATTIFAFAVFRLLLSAAETIGNPAALRLYSTFLTHRRLPAAIASINLAASAGAIAAPLIVPVLVHAFGWSGAFAVAGVAGICWAVWWTMLGPKLDDPVRTVDGVHNGVASAGWSVKAWGLVAAKALTDQWWWFGIYWLPDFFAFTFDMSARQWGPAVAVAFVAAAAGSIAAPRVLRLGGVAVAGYALIVATLPLAALAPSLWQATMIVATGMFAHQVVSTRLFLRICEPEFSAITGSLASMGAFTGHLLAYSVLQVIGALRDTEAGYLAIFSLLAACHCCGTVLMLLARRPDLASDSVRVELE